MKMLFPAPYEVPEKKAKNKAVGTRKGPRRKVVSDSSFKDTEARSSNKTRRRKRKSLPQPEGEKKRKATPHGEAEASKKGKTFLPANSTAATRSGEEWLPRAKPLAKS